MVKTWGEPAALWQEFPGPLPVCGLLQEPSRWFQRDLGCGSNTPSTRYPQKGESGETKFVSDVSNLQSEGWSECRGQRAVCASFVYKEILTFPLLVAVNRHKNSF